MKRPKSTEKRLRQAVLQLRGVGAVRSLCHGQRVHIGAYEQGLARLDAFEHSQHASAADAFLDGETEGAHAPCQRGSGPHLCEGQLWMLMQRPSQRDQTRCERLDVVAEVDARCHGVLSSLGMPPVVPGTPRGRAVPSGTATA